MPNLTIVLDLARVRLVAVGSANPVKLAAARAVLARVAPHAVVVEAPVASGVPDQPWGDEETRRGAGTRARAARDATGAELGIGFEGGVVAEADGTVRSCAWAAVVDAGGVEGIGGSLAMPLPTAVARRLRDGEELGHAIDALTGASGTKHRGGAVALLTAGLVDRQRAYELLLSYALAPWLGPADWRH
ncbi:MAG: DUF84 family protein [Gemmatirosa sp.]